MVLDINATTLSANPSGMMAVGSIGYFTADDGVHGVELWKSDGTAAGTALVMDVNPGTASSSPTSLTNVNGALFFTADDGVHGPELWTSDGTAAGTVLVKDIFANSGGSGPYLLTNVNGTLFFSAYQDATGWELWKSNGTAAGTVLVKDVVAGWDGSHPRELTNVNGTLFFSIHSYSDTYSELWKSDGTAGGTVLVKAFVPYIDGDNYARNLAGVNDTLFFTVKDATHGWELWKSNGTAAGTLLVKDLDPGVPSSQPSNMTNVNGTLYFTADDGIHGSELWKSDGTAAGTTLVKDVYAGGGGASPVKPTVVNGTLFFKADDGIHGRELWKSDGTAAGTVLVKDIVSNEVGAGPYYLTDVNGTLFFTVPDSNVNGTPSFSTTSELWRSDGTSAGTVLVDEIDAGSADATLNSLANVNGTLFFTATDPLHGREVWKSNGTAAGTGLVTDINTLTSGASPETPTVVDGTMFFVADDGVHGRELWKSDGTVAGTTLVKDIYPGGGWLGNSYYGYSYQVNSSSPVNLTDVNGTLFFTANDGTDGSKLWKSDGTAAGTVLVSSSVWLPVYLTDLNGTLFFSDFGGLWKSDGTAAGTNIVEGGFYSASNRPAQQLTNVNGTLFFVADDGTHGRELWKSDGTTAGTVLVKDIRAGSGGSIGSSTNLTDVNGTLFFSASDGTAGQELWKSDGTAAGTVLVKDIRPSGTGSYTGSYPNSLASAGGTLFFSASDGTTGYELWKSDGTVAGTSLVKDIRPGSANSHPYPGGRNFTYGTHHSASVNGTLFFTANNGTNGREVWKSDGTTAGTVLVKDINPGTGNYGTENLTTVNGRVFFTGFGGLWQSDGTADGTVPVTNLGASSLTNVNGTLYYSADDGVHGRELWMLVDDGLPSLSIGDLTVTEGHAGTRSATFTVTLSAAAGQPVTFAYTTTDASATAGSDYQAASGTLTFAPGDRSKIITVLVNGDRLVEPNETFLVDLSNATNAIIADGQGIGTIIDDEPRIRIGDATVIEGNIGTRAATFTVSLSAASSEPVAVTYATTNATATAGSDYQAASGTLTIPAGQTTGTIAVPVNGDRLGEPDETFFVNLSSPTNAIIADNQGAGTILDEEPRISISDVTRAEGKKGPTTLFVFTVTLSIAYDQPVTMSFATANGTATTSNNDYVAKSGTLTFAPGETTKTITIEVKGDGKREADETFYLDLFGNSTNSLLLDGQGVGTIVNDD